MKNYTIIRILDNEMFSMVKEFKTIDSARQYLKDLAKKDKDSQFLMVDQKARVYRFTSLKD